MNFSEITIRPIGVIKSDLKEPSRRSDESSETLKDKLRNIKSDLARIRDLVSEIEIDPELTDLLDDIDGYSHIMVLFWAHRIPEERRLQKKIHPMGLKEIPARGLFATCSPARPNPVLVTAVKLVSREGNILKVQGLEAIDGTPVVDIKPYVQGYHGVENPGRPEWMEDIHRQIAEA